MLCRRFTLAAGAVDTNEHTDDERHVQHTGHGFENGKGLRHGGCRANVTVAQRGECGEAEIDEL